MKILVDLTRPSLWIMALKNSHMEKRTPYQNVWREISREKPMVFLAGPRQSGKTTLAFQNRLKIPAVQLTMTGDGYRLIPNGEFQILISPAWLWLAELPWE